MRLASLSLSLSLAALAGCANHAKKSVSLYEAGDYAGAAREADSALANHPDDEALWGMRVRAALALGDAAGVAKAYGSYKAKRGSDDKALLNDVAIATLGQALASPSAKLKVAAIQAVQAAEIEKLAEQVAERMEDEDDKVAAAAAVAVLRAYPQAPALAADMMRSEDPEARRIAIDGVAKKIGKLMVEDLERAITDKDARVRRVAARWLGQIKDADAVAVLTRHLKSDPDESVRAASATALAKIGIGNLEALGTDALKDKALAVRIAAIDLLDAAKRPDRLQQVAQSDADPMVAVEAAIALRDKALAKAALDRAVAAEGWTLRAGAANVASRALGKDGAVALARQLLADKELGVRLAAARVLAHGGDKPAAAAAFVEALGAPDFALQAAGDLAEQGDARGTDALDAMVRDPQRSADQRAAAAAAHRAAHKVTPGLVAALADASGVVRVEAAAAIVMLARGKDD
ncbi:MAG: HEAT repeat domain-containing protein [Myxococcales bacterium]|nr:HEAT repeat domain-containing protein [Myxococcales bacterium]